MAARHWAAVLLLAMHHPMRDRSAAGYLGNERDSNSHAGCLS
jgi:hypothetical protein